MKNNLIKIIKDSSILSAFNKKINGSILENNSYSFNKSSSISAKTKRLFMPIYLNGKERNQNSAISIINAFFSSILCLNSQPVFIITPKKIKIHVCFYSPLNKYFIGRREAILSDLLTPLATGKEGQVDTSINNKVEFSNTTSNINSTSTMSFKTAPLILKNLSTPSHTPNQVTELIPEVGTGIITEKNIGEEKKIVNAFGDTGDTSTVNNYNSKPFCGGPNEDEALNEIKITNPTPLSIPDIPLVKGEEVNKKKATEAKLLDLKIRRILKSVYKTKNRFYKIRENVGTVSRTKKNMNSSPNLDIKDSIQNMNLNFKYLATVLSKVLNQNIELELVPLKYPYYDSNILAKFISLNTNKYTFDQIIRKLFEKAPILTKRSKVEPVLPLGLKDGLNFNIENTSLLSQLTGIKIKIAGRLITQRVIPKKTIKTNYRGSFIKTNNIVLNNTIFTSKNKNGAFTVNVLLSHGIIESR